MPPAPAPSAPLRFGRFEISATERVLRVDGQPAALGARAFDLLLALAQRRERLVSKQELLDLVWPGVVVEEHNITAQISSLRKLLGPQVIATVPGRGYQFTASPDVSASPDAGSVEPPPARHNLPEQRTRFIGRADALADLERLLPHTRLLTLTGVGGCGKTRLALQFSRDQLGHFPDGVWFVDLAPVTGAERVAPACAAALGLEIDLRAATSPSERLAGLLGQRHALIVLDNCEHVRGGAAALADAVLAVAGSARILATSREALGVTGEQLYPVRSLALPASPGLDDVRAADAVRVFVDRARLALPEFDVDAGNAATIGEICRRLDGIALAIELAAARVTVLSVADIALRLEDRFRLLTGGSASVARQQTLLATMQWSHDQLEPDAQRMLRALSVFAGGCTLEAAVAAAQAGDDYAALTWLTVLHDKSLLMVERDACDGGAGRPRYRMLETVRQYAQQQLVDSGEAEAVRARHAEHFLALAEAAAPHLNGPEQSQWMARLRADQENLAAAMNWCASAHASTAGDPPRAAWGLRLAAATGRYWLFNEVELGSRLVLQALRLAPADADPAARFWTLRALAAMYMHRGQREAGLPHARSALAIAERAGVDEWRAIALTAIGSCMNADKHEAAALHHFERARDLASASGSPVPMYSALNNIATIHYRSGRLDLAAQGFEQALRVGRACGDVRSSLIFLHNLLRVRVAAGRSDEAHACAVESESLLRGVGENALKLELLEVAAGLASIRGEHALAARLWGATTQRYLDAGYRRPPEDEAQLTRLSAQSRQALGDAAFDAAQAAGRALEVDAALVELRQWLQQPG